MVERNNSISSNSFHIQLAPGTQYANQFFIVAPSKKFRIKSISWDYEITTPAPNYTTVPLDMQTGSLISCRIGDGVKIISNIFQNYDIQPDYVNDFEGSRVYFHKPKQVLFDSWFITGDIPFKIEIYNRDPLLTLVYRTDLIVEYFVYDF